MINRYILGPIQFHNVNVCRAVIVLHANRRERDEMVIQIRSVAIGRGRLV